MNDYQSNAARVETQEDAMSAITPELSNKTKHAMRQLIPRNLAINFLSKAKYFAVLSVLAIIGSLVIWFMKEDSKYGIDFLGGHELIVGFDKSIGAEEVRSLFSEKKALVQSFEATSNQFSLSFESDQEGKKIRDEVETVLSDYAVKTKNQGTIVKADFVGPTVGKELRRKALYAVLFGLIGMLLYVAIRFEFAFGIGAVAAIAHDVIISFGIYLLCGYEIGMATLAAALTIVGYSINDTIIIFDRVREEIIEKRDSEGLSSIVNRCINSTLSRTLITSLLTFFSTLSLYLIGGGAIKDMSFFLCIGVIAGTYSTIYVASPVTIAWHKFRGGTENLNE